MPNIVWALTTIRRDVDPKLRIRRAATVGLFSTPDAAEVALREDWGDLDEAGYYQFAVIEPVALDCVYPFFSGSYAPEDTPRWWEHGGRDNDQWFPIDGEPDVIRLERKALHVAGTWHQIG